MPALPVLVFLVFLVLKLAEVGAVADWSWWWVTCPLWIGFALYLVFIFPIQLIIAAKARKNLRSISRDFRWR